jgi:glycosyltransferase involved in cell wall biosynthesis
MSPKVSIIVVVFNGAKTLAKTINSVLGQTYQNLELLIIDGGSTDGTLDILENNKSEKLFWTSEPDNGIYDAMNKGIQKATGDWIFFLGADDHFYNHQVLDTVFSKSNFENIDFVYGNVKSDSYKGIYDGEFNFEKILQKNISHQSIFHRRSLFDQVGFYNLKYKTHADWDFNLRCYENEHVSIKYTDVVIAEFGKGGVSSNYDLPFLKESLLPRKLEFLKSHTDSIIHLKNYDEWWRFIRNTRIRNQNDFHQSGYTSSVPAIILSMIKWQNELPQNLLKKGIFSKITMFANYIVNIRKIRN